MRILLIEDEPDLAQIVKKGLEEETYSVDLCCDGEEGLFMALSIPYDGLILDALLPTLSGLGLLKRLREKGFSIPVLMLTAKGTVEDKVKGLDPGADDYLTKPFEFAELLARMRALLRRTILEKSAVVRVDDLELDTATREVRRRGKILHLTAKEYALLECFLYNKNKVLSRTEITGHIYDDSFDLDSNIIDVFVNNLRKKVDKGGSRKLIHTVWGMGYILKE